jgi:hypothetical protein
MPARRGRNLRGAIRHESRATLVRASNGRKGADETADEVAVMTAATEAVTAGEGALSAEADMGITVGTSVAAMRHSAGRN